MKRCSFFLVIVVAICNIISGQSNSLIINSDIIFPKDSLEGVAIISSVNAFLSSIQENSHNEWVLANERIETQLLIDEILDIQKSEEHNNDHFYKGYLTNITPLNDDVYAVHIAYIGINENTASLRANFELLVRKTRNTYLISSPLKRNTQHWKTKRIQNNTFHYPHSIDLEKIEQFIEFKSLYDNKLKNNDGASHYYLCSDEMDPLKLFGVEYKSDYNGWKLSSSSWLASIGKKYLEVSNATEFYDFNTHDLWHNRLNQVISRKKVHHRVNCHIAYLHGGSWGISWAELFPIFSEKFVIGRDIDWLEHKNNKSHFLTNGRKNYTDDFIGALIVKQVEKENGFDGVWELLLTKRTKDEKEYFAAIKKLIGISKKDYNKEVQKLIEEEMSNHGIAAISNY